LDHEGQAGRLSRRALLAGGAGVVGGGVLLDGLPGLATSAPSKEQDVEVLNFVLDVERLQERFYSEALRTLSLDDEWRQFARVVGGQERAHRRFIEQTLGGAARPAPDFDLGNTLSDQASFRAAAVLLEDIGVAAYNGQATNLTPKALAAAARIASVESRHASWARDLAGRSPAPLGSDRAWPAKRVRAEIADAGVTQ
jgi:hypothetical protein